MLNTLDLFSGIGGITLALHDIGRTVAYCEIDRFATRVLRSRMDDGALPAAPICDDVQKLDADWIRPTVRPPPAETHRFDREHAAAGGVVDAIVGGFPCQDRRAPSSGKGWGAARTVSVASV